MKRWLVLTALLACGGAALRENPFTRGQLDVLNEDGTPSNTSIREDPFRRETYRVYRDGVPHETIREDPFVRDQWIIEDHD